MKKSIIFLAITAAFSTQAGNHIQFFKDGFAQINLEKQLKKDGNNIVKLPFSTVLESVDINATNGDLVDSYSISRSEGENANSFYEIDFDVSSDLNIKYEYQVGDIEWKPKYFIYFNDKGTFDFKYNLEINNNTSTTYENFTSDFIFYDINFRHYDSYNEEKKEDLSEFSFDKNGKRIIIKKKAREFNSQGFDQFGYDKDGFNKSEGFDRYGYNKNGFDKNGFNRYGFNKEGMLRTYGNELVEKIEDINVLNYSKSISLKPNSIKNISYFKNTYFSEKITYKFNYNDSSIIEEICHSTKLDKSIHSKMDDGIIRIFKVANNNNYLINESNFNKSNKEREIKICLDQKTMPKTSFSEIKTSIVKESTFETKDFNISVFLVNNIMFLNDKTISSKKYAILQNKLSQNKNNFTNEEIVIHKSEDKETVIDLYSHEIKNYKEKTKKLNSIMNNLSFSDKTVEEIDTDFGELSKRLPVNYNRTMSVEIEIKEGKLEFQTVKVSVTRKKK